MRAVRSAIRRRWHSAASIGFEQRAPPSTGRSAVLRAALLIAALAAYVACAGFVIASDLWDPLAGWGRGILIANSLALGLAGRWPMLLAPLALIPLAPLNRTSEPELFTFWVYWLVGICTVLVALGIGLRALARRRGQLGLRSRCRCLYPCNEVRRAPARDLRDREPPRCERRRPACSARRGRSTSVQGLRGRRSCLQSRLLRLEVDLGIEETEPRIEVVSAEPAYESIEGVEGGGEAFHVLPRHRPRSIASASGRVQGGASNHEVAPAVHAPHLAAKKLSLGLADGKNATCRGRAGLSRSTAKKRPPIRPGWALRRARAVEIPTGCQQWRVRGTAAATPCTRARGWARVPSETRGPC